MADSYDNDEQRPPKAVELPRSTPNAGPATAEMTSKVLVRELVALVLLVLLCDLSLYRGRGFAGPALLFLVAPILLALGTAQLKLDRSIWLLIPMLVLVSVRLLWCGWYLVLISGFVLLFCFAMSLVGAQPYVTQMIVYVSHLIAAGHRGLQRYARSLSRFNPTILEKNWFAVVLPVATLIAFATIFIMANPDVVIGLFAVYLAFEFQTLWFRTFPKGFHYSGYAHEGAAWLTVALGLATLMLSLFFRGTIVADPRLLRLKALAWVWSIENLLVALAVFNRLFIYIGFNGMTQMRVVGMLGVASVVGGFLLVLRKIARNHDFSWLIRRQMWTVSFATYLYAVLPVDALVNQFNVKRIIAGDPAPCAQISVHPTSDEGLLCLIPLVDCTDDNIREGVRAMLSQKLWELKSNEGEHQSLGWTAKQFARDRLFQQLQSTKSISQNNQTREQQAAVLEKFHEYAYQWY